MSETERRSTTPPPDEDQAPQAKATPDAVRDVVGRRGYDEAEDETATEDEEH